MAASALITSRDPKGRQAVSIFEAAYNQANLNDAQAKRLNENGGKLKAGVAKLIAELSETERYKDEKVRLTYGYPGGYKTKSPEEQFAILNQHFPRLEAAIAPLFVLVDGAKDEFLIPEFCAIAPTYGKALQIVLDKISETRIGRPVSYRKGELGPDRLRQSERKFATLQAIGEQQTGDTLVIQAQFGLRHRRRSVRRAREIFSDNEFGLGAYEVATMLLTHPDRFVSNDDLWIDCPGDEYAPLADGNFSHAPVFNFRDDKVRFGMRLVAHARSRCGSASGFVSQ